jgi:hypothetical protein
MSETYQITAAEYQALQKKRGKNKYNAETVEYADRKYDSIGERDYAIKLDWRKKRGEIVAIYPQFPIKILVGGVLICRYIIDFKIELKNGQIEYHEFKGVETDLWKLKWKLVHALYPDWKFVLIKK